MSDIGNKDILSANLQHYMNLKNVDRKQLCNDLDLKYSTVSEWISGNKYPRIDKIELMSNYFGIKKSDLIEKREIKQSQIGRIYGDDEIYMIPIFESVSAGFGAYADDEILGYMPLPFDCELDAKESMVIIVHGDSMFPKIEDGDKIVVRKQSSVDSGDVAVVLVDGEEGLVKKVVYDTNYIELQSFNPMYPPQIYEDADVQKIRVLGKVKNVIKTL